MANPDLCPICKDPLGAGAITVEVDGATLRVCCTECSKEAVAGARRRA